MSACFLERPFRNESVFGVFVGSGVFSHDSACSGVFGRVPGVFSVFRRVQACSASEPAAKPKPKGWEPRIRDNT